MSASDRMRERWADPAQRAVLVAALTAANIIAGAKRRGRRHSAAARANISAAQRRMWADPAKRAARVAAMSRAVRKMWADPAKRAARVAAMRRARRKSSVPIQRVAEAARLRRLGMDRRAIADRMGISMRTVSRYWRVAERMWGEDAP